MVRLYVHPRLIELELASPESVACFRQRLGGDPALSALADWSTAELARWGRLLSEGDVVLPGDEIARIEPLRADPKLARRQRVEAQRSREASSGKTGGWRR